MKTVIRSKASGQYLADGGSWTKNLGQAFGFADTHAVIATVQKYRLANVEMVIFIGNQPGKYDPIVTLRACFDNVA